MVEDRFAPLACEVVTVTVDQAPVLERGRLARIALSVWREVVGDALLACAIMPAQAHAVIQAADVQTLSHWVEGYKATSQLRLLAAIRRFYADDLLDAVTRYSPVWPEVVYRVWQDGYHRQELFSEARVAGRIRVLRERGILYLN